MQAHKIRKRSAALGHVTLGEGMPAVCVPVMGKTAEEIAAAALRAKAAKADVIELRIDSLSPTPSFDEALAACRAVRSGAGEIPLLFTLRTSRDGGAGSADREAYEALLVHMIDCRACDGIDVELSVGADAFSRIARHAHEKGVTVVGSSHEFGVIGDMRRAAGWLLEQQRLGADVCKAAVMTKTASEAFEAAKVYAEVHEQLAIPMIAIAMGPCGVVTRLCGEMMGSCLTFGTAGEASAPGQIDAIRLRTALEIVSSAVS